MEKDTVKIVVHDRRVEIEISGRNPPQLPPFAEQLIPEAVVTSAPASSSPAVDRRPSRAAGRVFLDTVRDLIEVVCAAAITKGTAILRWIISLFGT